MCNVKYVKAIELLPVIRELLTGSGSFVITVTGNSMYPFLRDTIDKVELTKSDFSAVRQGDIVLISRDTGELILHRMIRKNSDCFYLAGDAQIWAEGPVSPDRLIAVVAAVWRNGKRIECSNLCWRTLSILWLKSIRLRALITKVCNHLYRFYSNSRTYVQEKL